MAAPAESRPRYIAVVRRGEAEIFRLLKEYLESRGVAEVVWDRRVGDRRGAAGESPNADERRRADRRSAPAPDPWGALGFFIARAGQPRPASGRAARKGA